MLTKSYSARPHTRHGRAPASPRVSCHRSHLSAREGSGIVACPMASDPPPSRGGLRCGHVSHDSRPASQCGRALVLPRAMWLSACYGPQAKGKYSAGLLTRLGPPASEACPCIPEMPDISLIITSLGTRSRQRIKCVQDSHT
jgi:hypothetical protein